MQVLIVQLGGTYMQTAPLSLAQWRTCVALGALSIPVGYLLKLVPACERELAAAVAPRNVGPEGLRDLAPDEAGHLARTVARTAMGEPPAEASEHAAASHALPAGLPAAATTPTPRSARKRRAD